MVQRQERVRMAKYIVQLLAESSPLMYIKINSSLNESIVDQEHTAFCDNILAACRRTCVEKSAVFPACMCVYGMYIVCMALHALLSVGLR